MAAIPQGAIRFNTDSQKLEFYAQDQWWEMVIDTPNLGTGANTTAGARGLFGGGSPTTGGNIIDYVTITSTGNAISFGNLDDNIKYLSAFSSSTRGVWGGGETAPAGYRNQIRYVTISSTGDSLSFGTLTTATTYIGALSNSTRGIFAGGKVAPAPTTFTNTIQYVTIASTGNAVSFGQLSQTRSNVMGTASPTRGLFAGGYTPVRQNTIDYITVSTLGNATSFGNLTLARNGSNAAASPTRALFFCADVSPYTTIDYVTISTLGNAVNFGNVTNITGYGAATSNSVRGIAGGGQSPGNTNAIEYVNISTQANSVSFGQLTTTLHQAGGACSNAHGGL